MMKFLNLFIPREPSAREIATRELDESMRMQLHYQTTKEHAVLMEKFHTDRITRLKEYLGYDQLVTKNDADRIREAWYGTPLHKAKTPDTPMYRTGPNPGREDVS